MPKCEICPRKCGADRENGELGFCKAGALPIAARAGIHMWEEPCISGTDGSGTVFFSGCSLRCRFCQNHQISTSLYGKEITVKRLKEIFFELCEQNVHNINLVNPTHFTDSIIEALDEPLPVPVVWNSSGYERAETLKKLEGKIQIYLPDLKYSDNSLAKKYSSAPDYFETATQAIREMYRQTGNYEFDGNGILKKGVIIRHLILPEALENTYGVIDYVSGNYSSEKVLFSLMSQYTPCGDISEFPELTRRITSEEYEKAVGYMYLCGIDNGFVQELSSAKEEYIPPFNLEGI